MKCTYQDEQLVVLDEFLAPEEFARVSRFMRQLSYAPVNPGLQASAFRISDHMAFQGPLIMARLDRHPARDVQNYPTGSDIDRLISAILEAAKPLTSHLGRPGEDWDTLAVSPWVYPKGAGLSWHNDSGDYQAACTFYAHQEWDAHWGGLFLAAAAPSPADRARPWDSHDDYLRNASRGLGRYFLPLPNRCIFTKGGTFHAVTRVDENAGDRLRSSLSGFFLKPKPRRAPDIQQQEHSQRQN